MLNMILEYSRSWKLDNKKCMYVHEVKILKTCVEIFNYECDKVRSHAGTSEDIHSDVDYEALREVMNKI